ncbi:MAG: CsbD family protein [Opitutaceae bacterium]
MKSGLRDKIEGTAKEAKGKAKQKVAEATGDPQKAGEGKIDEARGKFQKKTGEIKRDIMRD